MIKSVQQLSIFPGKRLWLVFAGIFLLTGMAQAAQITLAWDESSSSSVTGYKLFYGTQSAKYTASVNAGNSFQYTISGLDYDTTYYFAAKAYDGNGNESGFSNEVSGLVAAPNQAPKTPVLYLGSSSATVNTTCSVIASASDSDGDALQYRFDWGDGMVTAWGGSSQSHVWDAQGTYCLKGQAQDSEGALSGWSACYEVAVTAADPPDQPPVIGSPGDGTSGGDTGEDGVVKLWLEAEDGDIAMPMEIAGSEQASSGGFIWAPDGAGNNYAADVSYGSATYHINLTAAGDYLIWARVFSPTYSDDSFFVSVDGGPYIRWNTQVDQDWVWDLVADNGAEVPMIYYLTQGSHVISVLQREDGTQLDRLLITNDQDYIPEGQGEIVQAPMARIWLEAEDGDIAMPMEIAGSDQASSGGFIWAPDGAGNNYAADASYGAATYHINVTAAGDYLIWARVFSPTYSDDSFFVSVDGAPYIRWNTQVDQGWVWDLVADNGAEVPMIYYLTQGSHVISVLQREDGTQLDRLLITNDQDYIPEGQGEPVPDSIPSGETVTIEAEDGLLSGSMNSADEVGASAGKYVCVPEGTGNAYTPESQTGAVAYTFSVPTSGDYVLWGRVFSSTYSNDSFWVAMDGETPFRWNTQVAESWTWDQAASDGEADPVLWELSAGEHTLVLMQREDGTMLDKIMITRDLTATPE